MWKSILHTVWTGMSICAYTLSQWQKCDGESRCSTSEVKQTRGKWYGTYLTKFQSRCSLVCCFYVGVYWTCFYSIHTKRERKRLCELKKTMQPEKQLQWHHEENDWTLALIHNATFDDNLQYRLNSAKYLDSVKKRPEKNGRKERV